MSFGTKFSTKIHTHKHRIPYAHVSVWCQTEPGLWIDDTFDNKKAELVEGGMSTGDACQIAYKHVLLNSRRNIVMNYTKEILEHTKLRQDPIRQKLMQEDDDYEPEEAMRYAVKKKKVSHFKSHWHTMRWWASGWWWWWWWWWWWCRNTPYKIPGPEGRAHMPNLWHFFADDVTKYQITSLTHPPPKSSMRKENLSQHISINAKKKFQRSQCCKCYSRKKTVHTLRHHTGEKESSPKNSLSCAYCSRVFGHSFNFRRHITVCKKKSVEPTKPDMEGMMLEMTSTKRHHRQNLEMGKPFQHFCILNERCKMNTKEL